jgi:hypothetical protein
LLSTGLLSAGLFIVAGMAHHRVAVAHCSASGGVDANADWG